VNRQGTNCCVREKKLEENGRFEVFEEIAEVIRLVYDCLGFLNQEKRTKI
jgi:hypothetical protein